MASGSFRRDNVKKSDTGDKKINWFLKFSICGLERIFSNPGFVCLFLCLRVYRVCCKIVVHSWSVELFKPHVGVAYPVSGIQKNKR